MKKISFLFGVGVLIAFLTALYTGYLFWQKSALDSDMKSAQASLNEVNNKVLKYQSQDIEQAIAAKQTLAEISDTLIEWSKIVKEIRRTIPQDKKGRDKIEILSYSGSSGNEITMNVKTSSDSDEPLFDVADLIESFNKSTHFVDNFVPSVSKGSDTEGLEVITFMFSTKYVEEDVQEAVKEAVKEETDASLEETLSDVLDESLGEDVPLAR